MASGPPAPRTEYDNNVCLYCNRPRHNIRHYQKNLRDGRWNCAAANVAFNGNSKRDHPYCDTKYRNRGRNGGNNNDKKDKRINGGGRSGRNDTRDKSRGYDQRRKRGSDSDGGDSDSDDNRHKVYRQEHRETGLIAVATTINPPLSLTTRANVELDNTWTIDSGCTRHVTHEVQWFSDISASSGSIIVDEKIPCWTRWLAVIDLKGNSKALTLHGVLYAPK
ncbi:LOW QUALITY PROTEIN: Uncharacterized protein PHPALM_3231 [Phytophthora palmivora]|uniref:Retrovirus-related Pol polyprotein from transposon TNT 1-94-like beta-barrel domain-containing protein n=1 Tax=Phytophthora palmivora TaxID=4796 RepID=A0A2P4YMX9_9STRA|nr:LOW QUALITY PROTEIN: Uncharacterized protein PHPALM_3231 [Phytophthora palmivora]